jgi:four helix bundle protein
MIASFTDLKSWQEGHKLALAVYKAVANFPKSEDYGLSSQLRRASSSVTSNIAEGFGRSSEKDREHFYVMASGSLYEVKSQLILARDLDYISKNEFEKIADQADTAHKLLHGLLRAHRATNV